MYPPQKQSEIICKNRANITELSKSSRFDSIDAAIPALATLAETGDSKILLVDDYSFNIDALMIILGLVLKLDVDRICDAANSGQAAIDMIVSNVRAN